MLCGAVLLAKLIDFVKKALEGTLNFSRIFAWTDWSIVLWIRSSSSRWKVFVANRVSYIHDRVLPSWWNHVPTSDKPADITSRGLLPEDFVSSSLSCPPIILEISRTLLASRITCWISRHGLRSSQDRAICCTNQRAHCW